MAQLCRRVSRSSADGMGAVVEILNPSDLPLPDDAPESHHNVTGMRSLVRW
ncbi:hypothetical protein HFD92_06390 [Pantoea sp. EKM101V]|uniref:hypothetical protein n=1 Tax=Pantoea TaxID=53335 RepID=UPI00131483A2|nr:MULTISPECIES: hypothetical protein [Pantoea]KAF6666409.1 hypothetical protein HFD92_06390 [Pantoea sp. EKM101V]